MSDYETQKKIAGLESRLKVLESRLKTLEDRIKTIEGTVLPAKEDHDIVRETAPKKISGARRVRSKGIEL